MKNRMMWTSIGVLLGMTASLVAFAAQPALAASCGGGQGQALLLGCSFNGATDDTVIQSTSPTGLFVHGANTGLWGASPGGTGVHGEGDTGVHGEGDASGVSGHSFTGTGVFGDTQASGAQNGVYGHANDSNGSGVYGQNDGTGYGVAGVATNSNGGTGLLGDEYSSSGVGVEADSSGGGTALNVNGKAHFTQSGLSIVHSGAKSVTVTMSGVSMSSMILATVQQSGGFYVKYAVASSGSFTVFINKAPKSPKTVKVAYFVLS